MKGLVWLMLKQSIKSTKFKAEDFLIIVIVIAMASLPLIGMVVYSGHDTLFHVERIVSIKNALADGQFPVRIYKETFNGYGYGCPLFYPEFFLYFPAFLCLLGCPLVISYNIFLIVINIATMLIANYSFGVITNSKYIGMVSAIIYELSVYRLVDLYTRGSMGEYLALIFCPLVLCGMFQLKRGECRKWWVLALGMSGVLQSHILSFVMMTFVCIGFFICNLKSMFSIDKLIPLLKAALLTVGLNLWFLVPFLQVSMMNVNAMVGTERYWDTDAAIIQLFDVTLQGTSGNEMYGSGIGGSLPKTPGIPIILGCILFLFLIITRKNSITRKVPRATYGFLVFGIIALCMLTNLFPWKIIKKVELLKTFFEKFQFMWRFNILVILFLSIVAAYGYFLVVTEYRSKQDALIMIAIGLCVYSLVYTNNYMNTAQIYGETDLYEKGFMDDLYLLEDNTIFDRDDLESNAQDIAYANYQRGNSTVSFDFEFLSEDMVKTYYIDVPISYYPGYRAQLDGKPLKTDSSSAGVVRVVLPSNVTSGHISVEYSESILFRISEAVSLCCLIGGLVMCVKGIWGKFKIRYKG